MAHIQHNGNSDFVPANKFSSSAERLSAPHRPSSLVFTGASALLYWRTPWKSVVALALLLLVELSLLWSSIISVFSWCGLAGLAYSLFLVAVRSLRNSVFSSTRVEEEPQSEEDTLSILSEYEEGLLKEDLEHTVSVLLGKLKQVVLTCRDLFLITSIVNSIKFGVFLYLMTFVGARLNFLTLVVIATLALFSLPKFYEAYQTEIDGLLTELRKRVNSFFNELNKSIMQIPVLKDILGSEPRRRSTKKRQTKPE